MLQLKELKESFLHLLFPHTCAGCGSDLVTIDSELCIRCVNDMPDTGFHLHPENPAEKAFWGRLPIKAATAQYYFTKESLMQRLMHQLKYKGNRELGYFLGRLMGQQLKTSGRFNTVQGLVPLPLFAARERKRGYNQATVLCEGMSETMQVPVLNKLVIRTTHTETQTRKGRMERWENMKGRFEIAHPEIAKGKHLLLVDDVITTGATLEACGSVLLEIPGTQLSIAALCLA
jgi:ComF family protein